MTDRSTCLLAQRYADGLRDPFLAEYDRAIATQPPPGPFEVMRSPRVGIGECGSLPRRYRR